MQLFSILEDLLRIFQFRPQISPSLKISHRSRRTRVKVWPDENPKPCHKNHQIWSHFFKGESEIQEENQSNNSGWIGVCLHLMKGSSKCKRSFLRSGQENILHHGVLTEIGFSVDRNVDKTVKHDLETEWPESTKIKRICKLNRVWPESGRSLCCLS